MRRKRAEDLEGAAYVNPIDVTANEEWSLPAVSSPASPYNFHVLYHTKTLGLLSIPSVVGMGVVALMRDCGEMSWSDFILHFTFNILYLWKYCLTFVQLQSWVIYILFQGTRRSKCGYKHLNFIEVEMRAVLYLYTDRDIFFYANYILLRTTECYCLLLLPFFLFGE